MESSGHDHKRRADLKLAAFPGPLAKMRVGVGREGVGPRLQGASMEFSLAELTVTLTGNRPWPERQAASGGNGAAGGPQAGFLEPRLRGRLHPDTGRIRARLLYRSPAGGCAPSPRHHEEDRGQGVLRGHLPAASPDRLVSRVPQPMGADARFSDRESRAASRRTA